MSFLSSLFSSQVEISSDEEEVFDENLAITIDSVTDNEEEFSEKSFDTENDSNSDTENDSNSDTETDSNSNTENDSNSDTETDSDGDTETDSDDNNEKILNIYKKNIEPNNIKYTEFNKYKSKKYLEAMKPVIDNLTLSLSQMMYMSFLQKNTKEKAALEWMSAYKIQKYWLNNKNNIKKNKILKKMYNSKIYTKQYFLF
tara:strand:+ start:203 stop:802 length:600 start_codon:yes stop_codon:yes gene_type:complete